MAFATASECGSHAWQRHTVGRRLQDELRRLVRVPLLLVDQVGFFQLVSSRYER